MRFGKMCAMALALAAICFCLAACGGPTNTVNAASADSKYSSGTHHAKVTVEGYDPFTITLDADAAPITVQNFCDLADKGFYNGLTFHRIVEGFCLQGGDPKGNGSGSADANIKGEFAQNGVSNSLASNFKKGVVAMARSRDNNSGSCQFFVTLSDAAASSLNGMYAAFGTIDDEGMKIVDAIVADNLSKANAGNNGLVPSKEQPKISKIEILD